MSRPKEIRARFEIVLVRWLDSQAGPGWHSRQNSADWAVHPGVEQVSVGFRLPLDGDDVILAQSLQAAPGGNVGDLLQIPRAAVLEIKTLRSIPDWE